MDRQLFQVFFYDDIGRCIARYSEVWGLNPNHAIRRKKDEEPELEENFAYAKNENSYSLR